MTIRTRGKRMTLVPQSVASDDIGRALIVEPSYYLDSGVFIRAEGQRCEGHGLHLTPVEALHFAGRIIKLVAGELEGA